jgi:hypothetical protein
VATVGDALDLVASAPVDHCGSVPRGDAADRQAVDRAGLDRSAGYLSGVAALPLRRGAAGRVDVSR